MGDERAAIVTSNGVTTYRHAIDLRFFVGDERVAIVTSNGVATHRHGTDIRFFVGDERAAIVTSFVVATRRRANRIAICEPDAFGAKAGVPNIQKRPPVGWPFFIS